MTWSIDARIPVVFDASGDAKPDDLVLGVIAAGDPAHAVGCACCVPRGVLAEELGRLFLQRARGEIAFFRRVVCDPVNRDALSKAVRNDVLVSARYRLD